MEWKACPHGSTSVPAAPPRVARQKAQLSLALIAMGYYNLCPAQTALGARGMSREGAPANWAGNQKGRRDNGAARSV